MIRNTSSKKQKIIAAVSAVLLAVIIIASVQLPAEMDEPDSGPEVTAPPLEGFALILDQANRQLALQDEVDAQLIGELDSGNYSFESPLVVTDPYGMSPLTALVLFTSSDPLNISIHVVGKDALTDIDFTFDGYNTRHIIPVYGLYPDTENRVVLTAKDQKGVAEATVLNIRTEPLPDDLSKNIILTDVADAEKYQQGLNFCYINKNAFDANGDYRWFLDGSYKQTGLYAYQNHYIVAKGIASEGDVLFFELNPLGRIYKIFYSLYGLHHDVEEYKNGDLLMTGNSGDTEEDFIYEMDMQTGEITNTLDLKTVFQRSRKGLHDFSDPDWLHLNAIVWEPGGDDIIISGRNQSLVSKISWPEGKISWILASADGWLPMFQKYLLAPVGETELPFYQHAPMVLPDMDNDPDTVDILLFDNGGLRFRDDAELQRQIANNEITTPDPYSRMVQYRIDQKKMTVEQMWEYGKKEGPLLYSAIAGDADLLANGNRLGEFEIQSGDESSYCVDYIEVDENAQVVWEAQAVSKDASGYYTDYRVERMPVYNDSANDLQIGEPAQNLVPDEVYERLNVEENDE